MKQLGLTAPYYLSYILILLGVVVGLFGCVKDSMGKLIGGNKETKH